MHVYKCTHSASCKSKYHRLGAKIDSVIRRENSVVICSHESRNEEFDEVILACHSDQALSIIKDPSASEVSILGAIPYQNNEVVLHTDTELLPNLQSTWSSWNYLLQKETTHKPVLTYNMNILQSLESEDTFCVTLNATDRVDPSKMLGRFDYSHPQFTVQGITAQQRWQEINGVNNTWFCGAYWGNGFHEDGVVSAMRVCERLQKVVHD